MILRELAESELLARMRGAGIVLSTGPFVVRIGSSIRELAAPMRLLYGDHSLAREDGVVDADVRIDPPPSLRRWIAPQVIAYIDGERPFHPFPRRLAFPMLEWVLNWCLFNRPHQYLILHAAVVERGGRALLLPGEPGAGKSTLCAGLILRGWRLLSDEVAIVRPSTGELLAVPRPVALKEESLEVIRSFEPAAVLGPSFPETRKGTVTHLRPPPDSVFRSHEAATARWIVFPRYETGAETRLQSVRKAETLLRAGRNGFNYSLLGAAGFESLADLVDACDGYDLVYGRLHEAVEHLTALAKVV